MYNPNQTIDFTGVQYIKTIFIKSQSADPAPPLGTVLGNIGANASNFCTLFNNSTKELPSFYIVQVTIYIHINKSTQFSILPPSTSFFLNALKFDRTIKVWMIDRFHDKVIQCVKLYEILQLAKFKFPNHSLERAFKIVWGTLKSMNLVVVR